MVIKMIQFITKEQHEQIHKRGEIKIDYGPLAPSIKMQLEQYGFTLDWIGDKCFIRIKEAIEILDTQKLITNDQKMEICEKRIAFYKT